MKEEAPLGNLFIGDPRGGRPTKYGCDRTTSKMRGPSSRIQIE
jgi:hypothetical protein